MLCSFVKSRCATELSLCRIPWHDGFGRTCGNANAAYLGPAHARIDRGCTQNEDVKTALLAGGTQKSQLCLLEGKKNTGFK